MKLDDYITRDPAIMHGQPVIRGTRVPVRTILASLAEGATHSEIIKSFPTLTDEAIAAAIAFEQKNNTDQPR